MAYTPLTPQQFQAAKDAGFSPDEIIANEKVRQSSSSGGPAATTAPTQGPVKAGVSQAFSQMGQDLNQGLVGTALTPGGTDWLNKPAFDMSQNTSGVIGIAAKSGVNTVKSLAKAGVGVAEAFDPTKTLGTIAQIPGAIGGYAKDASAAQQSQAGVQDQAQKLQQAIAKNKASGKDTSKLEAALKLIGPGAIGQGAGPISTLAQSVIPAATQAVLPKAVQDVLPTNIGGVQVGGGGGQFTKATQSVAEDPYQLLPAFLALKGAMDYTDSTGAKPLGDSPVGKAVDTTISKTAAPFIKAGEAVGDAAGKVKDLGNTVAKFATSQATGMSPKTITTILNDPKTFFGKDYTNNFTREALGAKVKDAIDTRVSDLSATGKEYQNIKQSGEVVLIPKFEGGSSVTTPIQSVLDKFGISLDKKGNIVTTAESTPMSSADISALQSFIKTFGNQEELSANAFLNARKALSNMSSYDAAKTDAADAMARQLRSSYDALGKDQLTGLSELDAKYAPETKLLQQIKKDYLKPDGTFKDNAISKLANLTNTGRESVLARLEQIVPGITKEITTLRAVEDISNASGQKVGAYTRSASLGGAAIAVATGNLPVAAGLITEAILTSPKVATQILAGWGKLMGVDVQGPLKSAFGQGADAVSQAYDKVTTAPIKKKPTAQ